MYTWKSCLFLGEYVAQFKYTVILMPNGPLKITGLPVETEMFSSEYSIEDEELKVTYRAI